MADSIRWPGVRCDTYARLSEGDPPRVSAVAAKGRVLVVDDEPRLCRSLEQLLRLCGYAATVAEGGKKAIALLDAQRFDLMLLDLQMPDLSGHQVMEHVTRNALDIAVIVVSGDTSFDQATRVLRAGAQDFLRKPYVPDELLRSVENVLGKRRMEAENRHMQQRLMASDQLHRFIVNNSPDIIYMLDEAGRFSFVNDRIETLLGYAKDELIGQHYTMVVYPEDLDKACYAFNERRTGSRATQSAELRLMVKGGEAHPRFFETRSLTIELNAMGVYAEGEGGARSFVGTYGVARDITERKKAEELINFQLYHDLLTKLPNRALFQDRLGLAIAQARRNHQKVAVMFLDLDRFKMVNDSLGHLAGDRLLQAVGGRLKDCLREGDTLARVGGDEFNLLVPELASKEDAEGIAEKILDGLRTPVEVDGHEIFVSLSIGIALYPNDGDSLETLIRHADMAMHHIKGSGKNDYTFFADSMDSHYAQHLSLETGMRKALEQDQFVLHYQPQIDIASGAIVGMEALLRWRHPERGLIAPGEFIAVAEETGLIVPIGRWVLMDACREAARWRREGLPSVQMSVNLSALQMERPDMVDIVLGALEVAGLPGESLELEITENMLMKDIDQVIRKLQELARNGIRFAVDDFGTGYSSLGYLKLLPLHTLKIDRSFVNDLPAHGHGHSIVAAIIAMAQGLGLNLIAEGVESQEQLGHLARLHCPQAQGFLFSTPVSAEEAMGLLGSRQRYAV
jgi:diguanylate cyclase (GGDEF)-like protein/PAS domain S-box-containing protein